MASTRFLAVVVSVAAVAGLLAGSGATAAPVRVGLWLWPLETEPAIVGHYLAPATPYAAGHRGLDLPADLGQSVHAPESGRVSFRGWVVDRPVISIEHAGGWRTSFEPVTSALEEGEAVAAGQVIGTLTADASHCMAPCLHVGLRLNGEYLNPLVRLGSLRPSVLLPLD